MEIDTEDKKEFLRACLGQRPFRKSYPISDGFIVFRSISPTLLHSAKRISDSFTDAQKELLSALVHLEQINGRFFNIDWSAPLDVSIILSHIDTAHRTLDKLAIKELINHSNAFVELIDLLSKEKMDTAFLIDYDAQYIIESAIKRCIDYSKFDRYSTQDIEAERVITIFLDSRRHFDNLRYQTQIQTGFIAVNDEGSKKLEKWGESARTELFPWSRKSDQTIEEQNKKILEMLEALNEAQTKAGRMTKV